MRGLEKALEWLRPLVESANTWEYCIVWKFGDDPSRYIEWMGCCCSGSTHTDCENAKEKIVTNQHLLTLCKDTHIKHFVRTKSCERLAKFPSTMPLYSGIHGEVAMTSQPRWLSHESIGTQVLIPVVSGLIEFFTAKHVPQDQKMIDSVISLCTNFVEHEYPRDIFLEEDLKVKPKCLPYLNYAPTVNFKSPISHPITYLGLEGSSTSSNPSIRSGSGYVSPNQSIGMPMDSLGYANSVAEREKLKPKRRTGKEQYHSKNLVVERNRRNRIKDGLFTLRALVPKITKMDRAAILGDAIDYIKELQKNIEELQDELRNVEEEECRYNNSELVVPKPERAYKGTTHSQHTTHNVVQPIKVQMEVHQIGDREFLLKFLCSQKPGMFVKLLEAISSLGLQVVDANVTTCNGSFLNILTLEANGKEFEAQKLKDSLLTSWSSQTIDGNPLKK